MDDLSKAEKDRAAAKTSEDEAREAFFGVVELMCAAYALQHGGMTAPGVDYSMDAKGGRKATLSKGDPKPVLLAAPATPHKALAWAALTGGLNPEKAIVVLVRVPNDATASGWRIHVARRPSEWSAPCN